MHQFKIASVKSSMFYPHQALFFRSLTSLKNLTIATGYAELYSPR